MMMTIRRPSNSRCWVSSGELVFDRRLALAHQRTGLWWAFFLDKHFIKSYFLFKGIFEEQKGELANVAFSRGVLRMSDEGFTVLLKYLVGCQAGNLSSTVGWHLATKGQVFGGLFSLPEIRMDTSNMYLPLIAPFT